MMLRSLLSSLVACALIVSPAVAIEPAADETGTTKNVRDIWEAAEPCFTITELSIVVTVEKGTKCPSKKMVKAAIQYAQDLFGPGDIEHVIVVYTRDAFWCGYIEAQGCTMFSPYSGTVGMVVSSVQRGWPGVTAHEFAHVIQVRAGHQGDHTPEELWRMVNTYTGEK